MLTKLEQAEQRWGGANKVIDQWLNHRRTLLIQYFDIAGFSASGRADKSLPSIEDVKEFCAQLVDYVSEGHFEVYDQVVTACATHGQSSKDSANKLLPQINNSTDVALDFSDKYSENTNADTWFNFDDDLSKLAQNMEQRFELEDQLLEILHTRHT